jgi:hypothetical protein
VSEAAFFEAFMSSLHWNNQRRVLALSLVLSLGTLAATAVKIEGLRNIAF